MSDRVNDPFCAAADPYPAATDAGRGEPSLSEEQPPSRRSVCKLLIVLPAAAVTASGGCATSTLATAANNSSRTLRLACEPLPSGAVGCRHRFCRYYGGE